MNRLNAMIYECLCDYKIDDDMNIVFNSRALALASMYLRIQTAIRAPSKIPVDFYDGNAKFRIYGFAEKLAERGEMKE